MDITIITYSFIGSFLAEILSMYSDKDLGTVRFLQKFFPDISGVWSFRINAMLMPVIGALLVIIVLQPDDSREAFLAGITWCTSIQTAGIIMAKDNEVS